MHHPAFMSTSGSRSNLRWRMYVLFELRLRSLLRSLFLCIASRSQPCPGRRPGQRLKCKFVCLLLRPDVRIGDGDGEGGSDVGELSAGDPDVLNLSTWINDGSDSSRSWPSPRVSQEGPPPQQQWSQANTEPAHHRSNRTPPHRRPQSGPTAVAA